jgi:uncharacterized protein
VIADTHGLLRPEVKQFLHGADRILHAGDIGNVSVLEELRSIAPVVAVRGNNDNGAWAASLAETATLEVEGLLCYLIHDRAALGAHPLPEDAQLIIAGHSHKPLLEARDGKLHMNPGSAGPRRFRLPIAIGEILITPARIEARIIDVSSKTLLARHQAIRPRDGSHINW